MATRTTGGDGQATGRAGSGFDTSSVSRSERERRVRRRLRPLLVGGFLQSFALWVPTEKLFMTELGFDASAVALVAVAYAVVVPALEVPSGVVADRWSRRNVAAVGQAAMLVGLVVSGASVGVWMYVAAALFLGVYLALSSGMVESMVYDTLVDEVGDAAGFERMLGRFRAVESAGLVASALAGGVSAALISPRANYFLTVPFMVGALLITLRFREPPRPVATSDSAPSFRRQLAATGRTLVARSGIGRVVLLLVLTAVVFQMVAEFGPLWLVELHAPTQSFGPQWAGVMGAFGVGGYLGGRLTLDRRTRGLLAALLLAGVLVLPLSTNSWSIVGAQIIIVVIVTMLGIPLTGQLHAGVPSDLRAGVASGVGTGSWATFLPVALLFGHLTGSSGLFGAAWELVALVVVTVALLASLELRRPPARLPATTDEPGPSIEPTLLAKATPAPEAAALVAV